MRVVFHGELEQLGVELATMCGLAGDAMEKATRALLRSDLVLAEQVISDDEELDAARARCEDHAFVLLSLQSPTPVARDLRLVVTGIRAVEKIERIGDLARHVAELARRRHPACAVPAELTGQFSEMGRLAVAAACRVQEIIAAPTRPAPWARCPWPWLPTRCRSIRRRRRRPDPGGSSRRSGSPAASS